MLKSFLLTIIFWLCGLLTTTAQTFRVTGTVTDESGEPLIGVNVRNITNDRVTATNRAGNYRLRTSSSVITLRFTFVGFTPQEATITLEGSNTVNDITLVESRQVLQEVEISGEQEDESRTDPNTVTRLRGREAKQLPSAFGEFSQVLATLPGVSNNNELSSAYSVRGGNFDENLVYVNGIPIYRPFLANSGRQEGLSFVNSDLVRDIRFYAGGWQAKYGDKLSSSLNIEYKSPEATEGSVSLGLLGGTGYIGGKLGNDRSKYILGIRHRDSRYLLNTLEVDGQYFPTFTDAQSLLSFDLSKKNSSFINRTKLELLLSYARNRYLTEPASLTTEFGTVRRNFRLQTAFVGREILNYDTYQAGWRLTHRLNQRFRTSFIGSVVSTTEQEDFDVEGAYRLCDVDSNPGSSNFDNCIITQGAGTNYDYGRNELQALIANFESRNDVLINERNFLEFGVGVSYQDIQDEINEYSFIDSAGFVTITETAFNELELQSLQYTGYIQNTTILGDSAHIFNYGVRVNYWDQNEELLISPRLQYRYQFNPTTAVRFAAGVYNQPPFYRELRDRQGNINNDVLAQKSIHLILSVEKGYRMWGRDFIFTAETYWKQLSDVVAYDVENIRLRYFANNDARAFARGLDLRVNGEFIQGTQSWFSLGILQTREDIENDGRGYIRRPTDQVLNLGVYFEDHLPKDPTMRVYLNMNIGSGYPFGPPGRPDLRNSFSGDEYYRVDLGLSKLFELPRHQYLDNIQIRAEILNALAADNTLSYTWIEDVTGGSLAIPNSLSARFLNLRLITNF
ncbi:MAG: carboxypeptidase-like regulatory domain-containing protein [Cytophagales bacterium]|nr:carboxypeptidase-like regulatory domain-containing protein [Cytophagales bacterium]